MNPHAEVIERYPVILRNGCADAARPARVSLRVIGHVAVIDCEPAKSRTLKSQTVLGLHLALACDALKHLVGMAGCIAQAVAHDAGF